MSTQQTIHSSLVVLGSIRYGETSLIVKAYTRELGIQSYLVRGVLKPKKSGLRSAYFQPLSYLEAVITHKLGAQRLETIKEAKPIRSFGKIHADVVKSNTALFFAEMLTGSVSGEQQDYELFDFIISSLNYLEEAEKYGNYLIITILELTRFLGIYPSDSNSILPFFDLSEGCFQRETTATALSERASTALRSILGTNFDEGMSATIDKQSRSELLEGLVRYYSFQITGFRRPKSLEVIKRLF